MSDERSESTPALVTELKRLDKAATCAPWKGDEFEATAPKAETAISSHVRLVWAYDCPMDEWDAELVLALRNAAPALLEAVETMHAALEKYQSLEFGYMSSFNGGPYEKVAFPNYAKEALARVAGLLGAKEGK